MQGMSYVHSVIQVAHMDTRSCRDCEIQGDAGAKAGSQGATIGCDPGRPQTSNCQTGTREVRSVS